MLQLFFGTRGLYNIPWARLNAAAQTISRAMTVFGGEMAMIGDFYPIDSPETEIDISPADSCPVGQERRLRAVRRQQLLRAATRLHHAVLRRAVYCAPRERR